MASIEGVYKATVQIGEGVSPVLVILKNGRFEGFDLDDRRFRGTYDEDPNTLDVVLTADISFWMPGLQGEPRTRETRPFSLRVPVPPDEVGVEIAAGIDLDAGQGSVVIERLSLPEFLT
jgi:hypothetical protein